MARLRPTDLRPRRRASSRTRRWSHRAARSARCRRRRRGRTSTTSWQPAAVAMPCTRAITGWGILVRVTIRWLHSANSADCHSVSSVRARISARSCPAQNPRPSAARTTTRGRGVPGQRIELRLQRRDHLAGQGVVAVAAGQGEPDDPVRAFPPDERASAPDLARRPGRAHGLDHDVLPPDRLPDPPTRSPPWSGNARAGHASRSSRSRSSGSR